jgi:invasion protein IalB
MGTAAKVWLCENSDAELSRRTFVSTTSNKKRTALAGTIERRKERKQFCAFSACARFHTAWVTNGSGEPFAESPVCPDERTSSDRVDWSVSCQQRTLFKNDVCDASREHLSLQT